MDAGREGPIRRFLADAGLGAVRREPLPGDASTRRYERLHLPSGGTLMLMDAPPSAESKPCPPRATPQERQAAGYNAMARLAAGRVDAFAAAAGWLREQGLSAPEVVAADHRAGLAVLEDLGEDLFTRRIQAGADPRELYHAAVEALARLHATEPPTVMRAHGVAWPLLDYDVMALTTGVDLFLEWWPKLVLGTQLDAEAVEQWRALWEPVVRRGAEGAAVFAHRDYHAENLIWLPEREGPARVGMLDFQDAVRAHPAWDLLSLLQDARRDVPGELEAAALGRYFELRPPADVGAFMQDYWALAALNNARILGIFARLIVRDHKPRYGRFLPRVWGNLERDLAQPGMKPLQDWFDRYAPASPLVQASA
ncbi:MAG: phosphotransferase [Proteobacteria bacterium]|nr:phosphotransferase [Pseudomonadota bacterium]